MPKDVSRYITKDRARALGRGVGRHPQTATVLVQILLRGWANISQRVHIYSFVATVRGRGPFAKKPAGLNKVGNLMLVCYDCHKKIDGDEEGVRYSAELLKTWKEAHETRIRIVTGISLNKKSNVVLYGSKIGDDRSPLQYDAAVEAMFPAWYPADERPINLSMRSSDDDSMPEYWAAEARNLEKEFDRQIRSRLEETGPHHFSVFALAPQPLLVQLGALLTDKINVAVYQLRLMKTWQWQPHPDGLHSTRCDKNRAHRFLSFPERQNRPERISRSLRKLIWEVTIDQPHNDSCNDAQPSMFEPRAETDGGNRANHPGLQS